jgi:hypothetical protein
MSEDLAPENSNRSIRRSSRRSKRSGSSYAKAHQKVELKAQVTQMHKAIGEDLLRTDPQTNRLLGKEQFGGSSYEMASSRHASQLAPARGTNGLNGNAVRLDEIQIRVQTPSNRRHASGAGSSQGQSGTQRVRSWRYTSGRRSRVNGYVCGNLSPSPNLGRNLSLCWVFLRSTESAGSMELRRLVGLMGTATSALRAGIR